MSSLNFLRTSNAVVGRVAPTVAAAWASRRFTTPRRSPRRAWEAKIEAVAARERLRSGGSYLRWPGTGPRVVCLHGWEGRATQFGLLAAAIRTETDFDVLALDGPAHGASPGERASPVHFAQALLLADHELGPFHAVIGHSMGGGAVSMALSWGLRSARAVTIAAPSSLPGVLGRFADFVGLPEAARGHFFDQMVAFTGFEPAELDIQSMVQRLSLPGLIVHDREDREVPFEDSEAVANGWAGARLIATEGLGHRRILKDPEVHRTIADFLA